MKLINCIAIVVTLTLGLNSIFAQDCSKYFPMKENTLLEYTSYDKKDKASGKSTTEVVEKSENGGVVEVQIYNTIEDDKGEIVSEGSYYVKCENGKLYIDLSSRFQDVFQSVENMEESMNVEAEFSGTELMIPNDLNPGQSLPDANIEAQVSAGPMKLRTFVNITNRIVESKDRIETPAGVFDCFKITSDIETKAMGMGFKGQSIEWIAEGIGTIKSESLNKKGKSTGYTLLTKIEN